MGLAVFIAGTLGFAVFGSSRVLSAGADSTITPIFAGALALLAASGSPAYFALAALLALMAGTILVAGGIFRLGWIANLLSIPVMTGFLAGIAIHIAASQLPAVLGLTIAADNTVQRFVGIVSGIGRANYYSLALGAGVFAVTFAAEKISSRIPGALIALIGATLLAVTFDFEHHGVSVVGTVAVARPHLLLPDMNISNVIHLIPLALIVAAVMMVQTAATTRAFASGTPDVDGDFIGVGVGSILSGLFGGFAVNASPPRTGAVSETGGRSQLAGLLAAAAVAALLLLGATLLTRVPIAALAGILLFVAQRIVRVSVFAKLWRQSLSEFLLILATMTAIVVLPIQTGVGLGIVLSLLHGIWTVTRARPIEFERIPGTTVWWPQSPKMKGEKLEGVMVLAFQAPLAFVNADIFERNTIQAMDSRPGLKLVVLEASGIAAIDFTAAQCLAAVLRHCRSNGINFAIARLESTRAQAAFEQFGLLELFAPDHLFHSVQDAIQVLGSRS
jgi:sulfate permease, SulP family